MGAAFVVIGRREEAVVIVMVERMSRLVDRRADVACRCNVEVGWKEVAKPTDRVMMAVFIFIMVVECGVRVQSED